MKLSVPDDIESDVMNLGYKSTSRWWHTMYNEICFKGYPGSHLKMMDLSLRVLGYSWLWSTFTIGDSVSSLLPTENIRREWKR